MKKIIFGLLSLTLIFTTVQAQDGKKALKQASRNLGSYNLDPPGNEAKLYEAIDQINEATKDSEVAAKTKVWLTKGQIMNAVAFKETNTKFIDPSYKMKYPRAGIEASEAYLKVWDISDKKNERKEAVNGLIETEGHLTNFAYNDLKDKNYDSAYENFQVCKLVSKTIKDNGGESRMDNPDNAKDFIYYSGVSAYYAGKDDEAVRIFEEIYANGNAGALVYEMLYNSYVEKDKEKAVKFLIEGRTAFPDDQGLLYGEINYSLKEGKLDELIDKLKIAIEKDPENLSIYTTLASVYDQLHIREREAGNMEQAESYFTNSYDWYIKALEKDPDNFIANYSIGTLYYNRAASMVNDLNALADDLSSEGTRKYNELKATMDNYFDTSLPHFQKAESLNNKDMNTLIALKEIHARKGEFEKSNAYKSKLEALENE